MKAKKENLEPLAPLYVHIPYELKSDFSELCRKRDKPQRSVIIDMIEREVANAKK